MNKISWKRSEDSYRCWELRSELYIYSADKPYSGRGYIARLYPRKMDAYPWIYDIDEHGNAVRGCSQGYTTLKEAKRRCQLHYLR